MPVLELVLAVRKSVLYITELRILIFGRIKVFLLIMSSAVELLNGKVCLTF